MYVGLALARIPDDVNANGSEKPIERHIVERAIASSIRYITLLLPNDLDQISLRSFQGAPDRLP
jgi:hypothetical protein